MEQMTNQTCGQFLAALAARDAVPGGGGACALVGAVGVALGNMVGNLTIGKKKYASVEADILRLNARAQLLRRELEDLVTADAEAFAPLADAYGLPRSTPEEVEHREKVMEVVLEQACAVPLRIMRCCQEALTLVAEYAQKGSILALSDAGVAAACCRAALQGASLNVRINTRDMKDRARAGQLNEEVRCLLETCLPQADAIFAQVEERLRG